MKMGRKLLLFTLVASLAYVQVYCQPLLDSGKERQCFNKDCPSGTVACKKVTETSDDKKSLDTTISCLDVQNMVLKDYIETVANPYGSSTTFKSTSFSGTYISSGSEPVDLNVQNRIGPNIEDFSR